MGRFGLAVVVCALGLAMLEPSAGFAQSSSVTALVAPSEVALPPDGSAGVVLVVSNSSATSVEARVQAAVTDSSVSVGTPTRDVSVAANASVALDFVVTRSGEGTSQDTTVSFVVDPTVGPTTLATLKVKAVSSLALVEAKIEANLQNINENRPGTAALVITNPRETSVTINRLEVSAPLAVTVTLGCPSGALLTTPPGETATFTACRPAIAPRSQEVLPIGLEVQDAVAPGPRSLLVQVTAARPGESPQSVVASTTFTVDVFAESDILKSIGVPIFLLLPGVIVVVTGWFLIRTLPPWRRVAHGVSIGDVVSKATAVAILGLAVSLVVALLYPLLTDWIYPGSERNYVKAYGFRDFYYVIAYSFLIAFLVWVVAALLFVLVRWLFLPWPEDDAASLLRKIGIRGRFGGGTEFPRVTIDDARKGLELGSPGDKTLVIPVIEVVPDSSRSPTLSSQISTLLDSHQAYELWRVVRSAVRDQGATIDFRRGDVDGPCLVETSGDGAPKIAHAQSAGYVVEVKRGT